MPDVSKNLGVLQESSVSLNDNFFGVSTVLEPKILQPDMNWTPHLGKYEAQSNNWFDTMGCVSYSDLNCGEMIINRMITRGEIDAVSLQSLKDLGFIDELGQFNASDRFLAKISGTTPQGNRMSTVANSVLDFGLLAEKHWPFDLASIKSFDQYYSPIPSELISKAKKFLDIFDFAWEWVGVTAPTMKMALQTSPLQVTVQVGAPTNSKGYIINPASPWAYGHAVSVYAVTDDHFKVFDHYSNTFKKYDLSYKFGAAMRFFIQLKHPSMARNPLNLPNNCKIFVVSDVGISKSLYLGTHQNANLDDKMIIDDPMTIDDQWEARNAIDGMFDKAPIRTISLADFGKYKKCNFKGQPIN